MGISYHSISVSSKQPPTYLARHWHVSDEIYTHLMKVDKSRKLFDYITGLSICVQCTQYITHLFPVLDLSALPPALTITATTSHAFLLSTGLSDCWPSKRWQWRKMSPHFLSAGTDNLLYVLKWKHNIQSDMDTGILGSYARTHVNLHCT